MKTNILILSLNKDYVKNISKELADMYEMFFLDINDILEYNLINNDMLQTAGKEYFDKEIKKTIRGISTYENTLIFGDVELLLQNDFVDTLKQNALTIYLKVDRKILENYINSNKNKENIISHTLIAFKEENKLCENYADIVVEIKENQDEVLQNIKKEIIDYFEKQ